MICGANTTILSILFVTASGPPALSLCYNPNSTLKLALFTHHFDGFNQISNLFTENDFKVIYKHGDTDESLLQTTFLLTSQRNKCVYPYQKVDIICEIKNGIEKVSVSEPVLKKKSLVSLPGFISAVIVFVILLFFQIRYSSRYILFSEFNDAKVSFILHPGMLPSFSESKSSLVSSSIKKKVIKSQINSSNYQNNSYALHRTISIPAGNSAFVLEFDDIPQPTKLKKMEYTVNSFFSSDDLEKSIKIPTTVKKDDTEQCRIEIEHYSPNSFNDFKMILRPKSDSTELPFGRACMREIFAQQLILFLMRQLLTMQSVDDLNNFVRMATHKLAFDGLSFFLLQNGKFEKLFSFSINEDTDQLMIDYLNTLPFTSFVSFKIEAKTMKGFRFAGAITCHSSLRFAVITARDATTSLLRGCEKIFISVLSFFIPTVYNILTAQSEQSEHPLLHELSNPFGTLLFSYIEGEYCSRDRGALDAFLNSLQDPLFFTQKRKGSALLKNGKRCPIQCSSFISRTTKRSVLLWSAGPFEAASKADEEIFNSLYHPIPFDSMGNIENFSDTHKNSTKINNNNVCFDNSNNNKNIDSNNDNTNIRKSFSKEYKNNSKDKNNDKNNNNDNNNYSMNSNNDNFAGNNFNNTESSKLKHAASTSSVTSISGASSSATGFGFKSLDEFPEFENADVLHCNSKLYAITRFENSGTQQLPLPPNSSVSISSRRDTPSKADILISCNKQTIISPKNKDKSNFFGDNINNKNKDDNDMSLLESKERVNYKKNETAKSYIQLGGISTQPNFGSGGALTEFVQYNDDPTVISFYNQDKFAVWVISLSTLEVVLSATNKMEKDFIPSLSSLYEICLPEDLKIFNESIDHIKTVSSISLHIELRMKLYSEHYEWYQILLTRSNSLFLTLFATNIHEHKKKVLLFQEIDQQLTSAMKYGNVICWYFEDTHFPLRVYNAKQRSSQAVNFNWTTVQFNILSDYQDQITKVLKDTLEGGPPFSVECPAFFNEFKWLTIRGAQTTTPGHLLGIMLDITTMKEAEFRAIEAKESAEESNNAKSKFLLSMSHEIRTPLGGICSLIDLLINTKLDEEQAKMLEIVKTSFTKLNELLNDTLDLAKIEQNEMEVVNTKFELFELLLSLGRQFYKTAKINGIRLYSRTSPTVPTVYFGDPHFLSRIFCNLISNAVKFTSSAPSSTTNKTNFNNNNNNDDNYSNNSIKNNYADDNKSDVNNVINNKLENKDKKVCIKIDSDEEGQLILKVKDNGIGISKADQHRIFEIFQQGDTSVTRPYGGIGVGLSLIKKMLNLIHGTISLKSELGVGSSFKVVFPFEPLYVPFVPRTLRNFHDQILILVENEKNRHNACLSFKPFAEYFGFDLITDVGKIDYGKLVLITIQDYAKFKETCLEIKKKVTKPQFMMLLMDNKDSLDPDVYNIPIPFRIDFIISFLSGILWKTSTFLQNKKKKIK